MPGPLAGRTTHFLLHCRYNDIYVHRPLKDGARGWENAKAAPTSPGQIILCGCPLRFPLCSLNNGGISL